MKLSELIQKHKWTEVRPVLLRLYPDQVSNLDAYERVYQTLYYSYTPIETDLQIVFEDVTDNEFGDYIDVSGFVSSDTEDKYAIEFRPWPEWLGMEISMETQAKYSELNIVVHCLWEMTYMGYSEVSIKEQLDEIVQAKENVELEDFRQLYDDSQAI